jgi:hypothetical protein
MSVGSRSDVAPASSARRYVASASATQVMTVDGIGSPLPSAVEASASMTMESPTRISACPIRPSGCGILRASSAPNVALMTR